jgi:hypothetical protein
MSSESKRKPLSTRSLDGCRVDELMRIEIRGEPYVAMICGPAKNGLGSLQTLVHIDKEGRLESSFLTGGLCQEITFIDYLTVDEKIEVFGSVSERNDETDLAHIADPRILPVIPEGTPLVDVWRTMPTERAFLARFRRHTGSYNEPNANMLVKHKNGKIGILSIGIFAAGRHTFDDADGTLRDGAYLFYSWLPEESVRDFDDHSMRHDYPKQESHIAGEKPVKAV